MKTGVHIEGCIGSHFEISVEDAAVGINVVDSQQITLQNGHFKNVASPVKIRRSPEVVARNLVDYGIVPRPTVLAIVVHKIVFGLIR